MGEFVLNVTDLYWEPNHPLLSKITSTLASSHGFSIFLLSFGVVQPQLGIASFTISTPFPAFLNLNVWDITSPSHTVPKSKKSSMYSRSATFVESVSWTELTDSVFPEEQETSATEQIIAKAKRLNRTIYNCLRLIDWILFCWSKSNIILSHQASALLNKSIILTKR